MMVSANTLKRFLKARVTNTLAFCCVLILLMFSGCHSEYIVLDTNNPNAPQYQYRLDEYNLLKLVSDHVFELEFEGDYGEIYDNYTSLTLREHITRRQFLRMTACVEHYYGSLKNWERDHYGFYREGLETPEVNKEHLEAVPRHTDILIRHVERSEASIDEELRFEATAEGVKLSGLYWIGGSAEFTACMEKI